MLTARLRCLLAVAALLLVSRDSEANRTRPQKAMQARPTSQMHRASGQRATPRSVSRPRATLRVRQADRPLAPKPGNAHISENKALGAKASQEGNGARPPSARGQRVQRNAARLLKQRKAIRELRGSFSSKRKALLADQGADAHVAKVMAHSETGGQYHVLSDLHWGQGRNGANGDWSPHEDFRKQQEFARFVKSVGKTPHTTIVMGGDWLELMEHAAANAPIEQLKSTITRIVEGHAIETRAMATAMRESDLHVLYIAGNHDVHLVNPEVREHLVRELARVGGVKPSVVQQRMAYSGHGAVLGKFGEGMVVHGHVQDASNNWRSPINPYNARRQMQANMGWSIVQELYLRIEAQDPTVDNIKESATKSVALKILTSPRYAWTAIKLAWDLLGREPTGGKADRTAERLDDRVAMRAWSSRTGMADRSKIAIPGAARTSYSDGRIAQTVESIYADMPRPVHTRMRTASRIVNLLGMIATAWQTRTRIRNAEPSLLRRMTSELGNVRYVIWGHNHKEAVVTGKTAKGEVAHYNTGTWTLIDNEWRLNVVTGKTDEQGRLHMTGVFRTNQQTGEPNLPNKYSQKDARPVPGWETM